MNKKWYKIIALLIGSFDLLPGAQAQTATWDSTYRPAAFLLKVEQFKSYKNAPTDIIFLGNSITAGTDWNELLGMSIVKNRGISGDISFGVLERLDEVIGGKPAKVFILIGINDISRNIPDEIILKNYARMISRIKAGSPSTKIYFHTLMPTNESFGKFKNHYHKEEHIRYVNDGLKELAKKEQITLIDLFPVFLDKDGKLEKSYTVDGLHLNTSGYLRWAELLKKGNYLND